MALNRSALAVGLLLSFQVGSADAQRRGRAESTAVRQLPSQGLRAGRAGVGATQDTAGFANRRALAQQVRQHFNQVVRRELELPDDKWRQLQQVDRRFQQQRNAVTADERQTRLNLKAAMADSVPDQTRIDQYMNQLLQAGHRRADLLDAEQKELAGFLTPLQRAKYQSLHEQFQRSVARINQANGRGATASPPAQPPTPPTTR